jgi:hypothetical protein
MKHSFWCLFLLFASLCGEEIDLSLYEKSLYSQNGEDGVLAKIFQVVLPRSQFCVEFSSYDGVTDSNIHLFRLQGWKSVQFDRQYQIPKLNLYKEFVNTETIDEVFDRHQISADLDLVSIDVGYNDFYLWKALDPKYRPSVVVIAYNASLALEDKVVKYRPFYVGDDTNYYGASLPALYRLGRSKGYSLVYAESSGTNLFFIRDDLLTEDATFKDRNEVEKLYRPPKEERSEDFKQRPYFSSEEVL